jgi:hypothetical protein
VKGLKEMPRSARRVRLPLNLGPGAHATIGAEAGQTVGGTIVSWALIILGVALVAFGLSGGLLRGRGREDVDRYIPAKPLSDEHVATAQSAFERRLESDNDLSDTIVWGDAYIYWQLMSKWSRTLLETHRNDDKLAARLRKDWLDYLHCLQTLKAETVLSGQANHKRDLYGREAEQSWRTKVAIEDAFATAIGDEALQLLRRVRAANHVAFDRSGKKPMATDGYYYSPVSFRPYAEELKPQRRPKDHAK